MSARTLRINSASSLPIADVTVTFSEEAMCFLGSGKERGNGIGISRRGDRDSIAAGCGSGSGGVVLFVCCSQTLRGFYIFVMQCSGWGLSVTGHRSRTCPRDTRLSTRLWRHEEEMKRDRDSKRGNENALRH